MANKLQRLLGKAKKAYEKDDLSTAKDLYQSVLNIAPRNPDALHAFGVILAREGKEEDGLIYLEKAYQHKQNDHRLNNDIGNVLLELERYQDSLPYLQKSLKINASIAIVYTNLAMAYKSLGQLKEAENILRQVLKLEPDFIKAYLLLAFVLFEDSRLDEVKETYEIILKKDKNNIDALYRLGLIFHTENNVEKSREYLLKAFNLDEKNYDVVATLGDSYMNAEEYIRAEFFYKKSLHIKDNYNVVCNVATICFLSMRYEAAEYCYIHALKLNSTGREALHGYALVLEVRGDFLGAAQYFEKSLQKTDIRNAMLSHANLLLLLNYIDNISRKDILKNHLDYNNNFVNIIDKIKHLPKLEDKNKKIRIAYVSSDFRMHSVAYFMMPILMNHDHNKFEVHLFYMKGDFEDIYTDRIKNYADVWHVFKKMTFTKLSQAIIESKIDILIDLSGHTGGTALPAFFSQPAPVQISYLGYPATTGVETIEYKITDKIADPVSTEIYSSEKYLYMPDSYFCYEPLDLSMDLVVCETPCIKQKYITLGTFNNYMKVSDFVLNIWGKIYKAIGHAKFIFKHKNFAYAKTKEAFLERLINCGIKVEDIELVKAIVNPAEHLELYNQLDIALDTFPYNGATTTCEALWMGVPVVALQGELHASNMSSSILSAANLNELICYTADEYIEKTVALANDVTYLNTLRLGMRERMQKSPLMDGVKFTMALEKNYQLAWSNYCEKEVV